MRSCLSSHATSPGAGVLSVLTLELLAFGCGRSPTAPSPSPGATPSPDATIAFLIVGGMNVVGVGATTPLTAKAYPGYPSRDYSPIDITRQALWVSSDTGVANVSAIGQVSARSPGTAEISASYQGKSYALPLVVVGSGSSEALSQYIGTWSGEGTMTCKRLSGVGRDVCDFDGRGVPDVDRYPIELTLGLTGNLLTGTLRLYQSPTTGPVQAALLDSGELVIGGTLRSDEGGAIIPLREWRLRPARRGQLVGTVTEDAAFVNVYSAQLKRETCEVNGLSRAE